MKSKAKFSIIIFSILLLIGSQFIMCLPFNQNLSAPTGLAASDGTYTDKIALEWNSVEGAEKYYIYESSSQDGTYNEIDNVTGTTANITGMTPGETYWFKVKAYSEAAGYSDFSNADSGYAEEEQTIDAPTGLTASDGTYTDKIVLDWDDVTGADKYYVFQSDSETGSYGSIGNVSNSSAEVTGVTPGETYWYKIKAYSDAAGYSDYSNADSGYADVTSIDAPTGLTASDGTYTDKIALDWDDVTGAESYNVYESTSEFGTYTNIGNVTGSAADVTGGTPGTIYWYKVKAYSAATGESDYSNADSGFIASSGTTYTLTITIVGNGSVDVSGTGVSGTSSPYTVDEGSSVTLDAVPDSGYLFDGWSGDLSGTNDPETIAMNSDYNITATFIENTQTGTGTQLFLDQWEDGDLSGSEHEWFWFYATPGNTYRIHNHDDYYTHPDNPGTTSFDSEVGAYETDMSTSYTYTDPSGGTGQQDIYDTFDYVEFDATEDIVQVKATQYGGGTGSGVYWLKITEYDDSGMVTRDFWVNDKGGVDQWVTLTANRRYQGTRCNIWIDQDIDSTFSQALVDDFGQYFDDHSWPDVTTHVYEPVEFFGEPGDRINILFYSMNPSYAGYFWSKDFYDDSDTWNWWGVHSNETNIFYMNGDSAPGDPSFYKGTLTHEFQHMCQAHYFKDDGQGRRMDSWANEACSILMDMNFGGKIDSRVSSYNSDYNGDFADGNVKILGWGDGYYQYVATGIFNTYIYSQLTLANRANYIQKWLEFTRDGETSVHDLIKTLEDADVGYWTSTTNISDESAVQNKWSELWEDWLTQLVDYNSSYRSYIRTTSNGFGNQVDISPVTTTAGIKNLNPSAWVIAEVYNDNISSTTGCIDSGTNPAYMFAYNNGLPGMDASENFVLPSALDTCNISVSSRSHTPNIYDVDPAKLYPETYDRFWIPPILNSRGGSKGDGAYAGSIKYFYANR